MAGIAPPGFEVAPSVTRYSSGGPSWLDHGQMRPMPLRHLAIRVRTWRTSGDSLQVHLRRVIARWPNRDAGSLPCEQNGPTECQEIAAAPAAATAWSFSTAVLYRDGRTDMLHRSELDLGDAPFVIGPTSPIEALRNLIGDPRGR